MARSWHLLLPSEFWNGFSEFTVDPLIRVTAIEQAGTLVSNNLLPRRTERRWESTRRKWNDTDKFLRLEFPQNDFMQRVLSTAGGELISCFGISTLSPGCWIRGDLALYYSRTAYPTIPLYACSSGCHRSQTKWCSTDGEYFHFSTTTSVKPVGPCVKKRAQAPSRSAHAATSGRPSGAKIRRQPCIPDKITFYFGYPAEADGTASSGKRVMWISEETPPDSPRRAARSRSTPAIMTAPVRRSGRIHYALTRTHLTKYPKSRILFWERRTSDPSWHPPTACRIIYRTVHPADPSARVPTEPGRHQ